MDNVYITVMGKTGAGKSALINALIGKDVAPTGIGQAVTRKNTIYSKKNRLYSSKDGEEHNCTIYFCDTVGLEIDSTITENTLKDIKSNIKRIKGQKKDDIQLVWFCINEKSSRFEDYELTLLKGLSMEYGIPFVIVITRCINDRGELEQEIDKDLPEILKFRVLAKDYKYRNGEVVRAFGTRELLRKSIANYKTLKIDIIQKQLLFTDNKKRNRIAEIERSGQECIKKAANKATRAGAFALLGAPFVHGICISMINDLNKVAGLSTDKSFASDIFQNIMLGIIVTPAMAVPLVSMKVAEEYIMSVGKRYLNALLRIMDKSTDQELQDMDKLKRKLARELRKLQR